jgi:hypothetical protein
VQAANDLAVVLADSLYHHRNTVNNGVCSGGGGTWSGGAWSGGGGVGGGGGSGGSGAATDLVSRLDDVLQRTYKHSTTKGLRNKIHQHVLAGAMWAVSNSVLTDNDR